MLSIAVGDSPVDAVLLPSVVSGTSADEEMLLIVVSDYSIDTLLSPST